MSEIDWRRSDESYQYDTFGHFAVFERPDREPESRSPLQRAMRQVKALRGRRYWDHILDGGNHASLGPSMHQSWFQLPARQKEERLLRFVDWSGVSDATREKVIARELRSRDGEINARDEWHLRDQLNRVERITPGWDRLSSTAKLETLLAAKEVDWRPFPGEFRAMALGSILRRSVTPNGEGGFDIGGAFDAGNNARSLDMPGGVRDIDSYEQSLRKGPRRPLISKAEARDSFRWSVAEPRWKDFVARHAGERDPARVHGLREQFREDMRPLWREFWAEAKGLDSQGASLLAIGWRPASESYETSLGKLAGRTPPPARGKEGPER